MRKLLIALIIIAVILITASHYAFKPNQSLPIAIPAGLDTISIFETGGKLTSKLYVVDYKGYSDSDLENRLNTKVISQFRSSSDINHDTKTIIVNSNQDILDNFDREIYQLYFRKQNRYALIGDDDSCLAILKDKQGALYITSVFFANRCMKK